MLPFNNELQIGQPALIIGCHHPENSDLIGKTVTVVDFISFGDELPNIYMTVDNIDGVKARASLAVVEGVSSTLIIPNHAFIQTKYLMPLPPLGDVYDSEMLEELENLKVKA